MVESLCALALGLLTSAAVADAAQATLALPMLCFPQVLFAGAVVPVAEMAGAGRVISAAMANRWAFEALGRGLHLDALDRARDGDHRVLGRVHRIRAHRVRRARAARTPVHRLRGGRAGLPHPNRQLKPPRSRRIRSRDVAWRAWRRRWPDGTDADAVHDPTARWSLRAAGSPRGRGEERGASRSRSPRASPTRVERATPGSMRSMLVPTKGSGPSGRRSSQASISSSATRNAASS